MKRILLGLAASACALGVAAPIASARIVDIGTSTVAATPSCPEDCQVVTRTTALPVNVNGTTYPTTVRADGRIVALTVQLGEPTIEQTRAFNRTYGGTPRVQLAVLSQTSRQRPRRLYTVSAQSEVFRVTPWFGTTVQFPFEETLEVRRGDYLALSIPTWAPILAINLDRTNLWRASRAGRCDDFLTQTAQLVVDREAQYKCLYQTARLTWSATMVTTPRVPRRETRRGDSRRPTSRSTTRDTSTDRD